MIRIGINGYGRIGRSLTRVLQHRTDVELVAINDIADVATLVHLLKYDSVHGRFPVQVKQVGENMSIGGKEIICFQENHPQKINWAAAKVDIVIEATGFFKEKEELEYHIKNGARGVILAAPAQTSDIKTIVLGVNEDLLNTKDVIISNASCTTNCAAPMIQIIDDALGIKNAYVTTVHSFTTDQKLHDAPHKDLRRARAATLSMVPTTTGAAKALSTIFPELNGHLGGCGIRVPVPDGSLTDITFQVKKNTNVEVVNKLFLDASTGKLADIVGYTDEPLVSADIVGQPYSCLFDSQLTSVMGKMVKIVAWYDNEMGYSNRLADLVVHHFLAKK